MAPSLLAVGHKSIIFAILVNIEVDHVQSTAVRPNINPRY